MVFRKIKVSIIVPVYNAEKYLDRCIHSLIGQTYGDIEIILVDDDSTDSSPVLCDGYAKSDCRIRVIHKENEGAAMARKDGLATACGEYVLFVDSDDWIDPDTVEVCLKTALQDGSDCVMFGYIREYPNRSIMNPLFSCGFSYDTVKSEELIHRRIVGLLGEELAEPHRIDNLSSLAMRLWHIDTVNRGRFVSERTVGTSEDTIFCLYALEGCRISYIDRCFYHYRKDNRLSITTAYKADLAEKWDVMYSIVEEYIESSKRYGIAHILPSVGIVPVIITGRASDIVKKRAEELSVTELYRGVSDKLTVLCGVAEKYGVTLDEVAYIGDDLNDLECIRCVGRSACPADAVYEVVREVGYLCELPGGRGAVREFIDLLAKETGSLIPI